MLFFDPMYLVFALPALLLALYAQMKVQSAYNKWLQVANARRMSGQEAARYLLSAGQMGDVMIEGIPGKLTDNYDPRSRVLHLSQDVANGRSVASLAIVAHEVGHAQQDAQNYAPLKLRGAIVPAVQVGAWVGPLMFLIGFFLLRSTTLAWLGLILFSATVVFALVTLPTELNASSRAMTMLRETSIVTSEDEAKGAREVLSAAALTYVAALAQAIMTMLYYIFLLTGSSRRR